MAYPSLFPALRATAQLALRTAWPTYAQAHRHQSYSDPTIDTVACKTSKGFPCKAPWPIPKSDLGVVISLCGAGGHLGKFLALQLKLSPLIKQINMFDLTDTFGVACDLNHINTRCKVKSFHGPKQLKLALKDVDIVLMMAGKTWRPGMSSEDLFHLNVGTVRSLAEATAHFCPDAIVGVITRPINSFVPLINEVYKRVNRYNPDKVIGMLTHEVMKANSIVAMTHYLDASGIHVPIIGGTSNLSVVPLFSLARPYAEFSRDVILKLADMIRTSEVKVTEELKHGPAISGGFAAARFALTLVRGMCEQEDAVMSAYVRSNVLPHCKYFANQLKFGPGGVVRNFGIPKISTNERALLEQAIPEILADIKLTDEYMKDDDLAFSNDIFQSPCPR